MVGRETSGRRSSWIRPYYRFKIMLPVLSCLVACIGTAAALREARAGGSGIRTHQSSQEHFTYAEQPSKHTHTQFWGLTDKITAIGALRGGGGSSPASHFGKINQDYLIRSACAGVIASTALECVLYPLDTLKTRIQTRQVRRYPLSPLSLLVCLSACFSEFRAHLHACYCGTSEHDVLEVLQIVDDTHWFLALFDGTLGNIIGMAPAAFIFFLVYEPVKAVLLDLGLPPSGCHLVSATCAILSSSTLQIPNDVVKIAMQSRVFKDMSAGDNTKLRAHTYIHTYISLTSIYVRIYRYTYNTVLQCRAASSATSLRMTTQNYTHNTHACM